MEPLPFSLDYSPPNVCPDHNDAFQMIRKRSRRVRLTRAENTTQHLKIEIAQTTTGFRGELTVTRNDQATDSRVIQGHTCAEVVDALALTAALSLDPDATPIASTREEITPEDPAPRNGADSGDPSAEKKPAPRTDTSKEAAQKPSKSSTKFASPSEPALAPSWHFSLGLQGSIERVMDTSWHLGAGLTAGLRRLDDQIWFPIEVAMDLRYLGEIIRSESELVSRLALARLSYCLLRVGNTVTLLACPTAQLGLLVVQGENLETVQEVTRLYASAGIQARLRTSLYQNLEAQLITSLNVPLVPRHFAVDPGPTMIGSTTALAFDAAIGLNWVF